MTTLALRRLPPLLDKKRANFQGEQSLSEQLGYKLTQHPHFFFLNSRSVKNELINSTKFQGRLPLEKLLGGPAREGTKLECLFLTKTSVAAPQPPSTTAGEKREGGNNASIVEFIKLPF